MGAGGGLAGLAAVMAAAVLCGPGALAGRVLSGECAVRERGAPGARGSGSGDSAGRTRHRLAHRTTRTSAGSAWSAARVRLPRGGARMMLRGRRGCAGLRSRRAGGLRAPPAAWGPVLPYPVFSELFDCAPATFGWLKNDRASSPGASVRRVLLAAGQGCFFVCDIVRRRGQTFRSVRHE